MRRLVDTRFQDIKDRYYKAPPKSKTHPIAYILIKHEDLKWLIDKIEEVSNV